MAIMTSIKAAALSSMAMGLVYVQLAEGCTGIKLKAKMVRCTRADSGVWSASGAPVAAAPIGYDSRYNPR